MDPEIRDRFDVLGFNPTGPVASSLVQSLEQSLGVRLPRDYSDFLRATGGGDFSETVLCRCLQPPPIAAAGRTLIGGFLGFSPGESSIQTALRRTREIGMAQDLLPIADVDGGDFYCLRLGDSGAEVVYWDHDSGDSFLTAVSFADFVSRLERGPELMIDDARIIVHLDPDLL